MQAVHRIHKAAELNRVCTGDLIVKHSTLAVDATACFHQIKEFWRQLAWPDLVGSYNFVLKIIDVRKRQYLVNSILITFYKIKLCKSKILRETIQPRYSKIILKIYFFQSIQILCKKVLTI